VLDIIPTHKMFGIVNQAMATATHHWFFLIQPYDFPERLIGAAAEFFVQHWFKRAPAAFTPEALAEYTRCFCQPAAIHATCEDYRAGASIDLVHDEASRTQRVTCPLLALWSATGYVGRTQNVLQVWRDYATDVRGQSLPCGHFLAEEMPDETYALLQPFLLSTD
jgi:haloacetate dehalogenase